MPKMDGPTATTQLRNLGFDGLIIGLTGQLLEDEKAHFLNSGADEVLGKPLNTSLLAAVCHGLLGH